MSIWFKPVGKSGEICSCKLCMGKFLIQEASKCKKCPRCKFTGENRVIDPRGEVQDEETQEAALRRQKER